MSPEERRRTLTIILFNLIIHSTFHPLYLSLLEGELHVGLRVSRIPLCVECLHSPWHTAGIQFVQTERMHNVWDRGLGGRVTQQV